MPALHTQSVLMKKGHTVADASQVILVMDTLVKVCLRTVIILIILATEAMKVDLVTSYI